VVAQVDFRLPTSREYSIQHWSGSTRGSKSCNVSWIMKPKRAKTIKLEQRLQVTITISSWRTKPQKRCLPILCSAPAVNMFGRGSSVSAQLAAKIDRGASDPPRPKAAITLAFAAGDVLRQDTKLNANLKGMLEPCCYPYPAR
jgi:hypothetical protein